MSDRQKGGIDVVSAAFVHGFLLALALILPIGPQNSFILSQGTIYRRYRMVLPVVAAAGLSDTVLIVASVGGVGLVAAALPWLRTLLTIAGVVFLIGMGIQSWREPGAGGTETAGQQWPLRRRVGYSLSVSLLNPHAIMDTVVVIGGGGAQYPGASPKDSYAAAAVLVSWLWFIMLSLVGRGVQLVGGQMRMRRTVNRGSALLMWAFAAHYSWQLLRLWLG